MQCPPANSFTYNSTLCACNPGYIYNTTGKICSPFTVAGAGGFLMGTGVDYSINIPETILPFDSIKKYTQSQNVFLGATAVMIVSWFLFCFFARFGKLGDGTTYWFKIRWLISRLDICFGTRHWLDDQKVVRKRKTELGGAFSIASCILFIGLFATLLYQIISKRTIEVRNVRAANAPDLTSFSNDMEFNITTISSMSCSNLRGLGTLLTGNPGFLDFRTTPLSTFANFSCHNTTNGPMVTLKCNNCRLRDNFYTSWQFLDLPNMPASAVGFEFNVSARDPLHKKHVSFVSGILKNGSNNGEEFVTFRGSDLNILQFNLCPRIYRNKHGLKLIQPLFHEFLPGSSFDERNQLRASLENSSNGLVNITLHVNFLSSYIVEIDDQNILGPVGFLADLGGLYCLSTGLFFYLMLQFEYRFKKFRYEDNVMRSIRNRKKARERWDKLRKYVIFTWGRGSLPNEDGTIVEITCCPGTLIKSPGNEGSSKRRQRIRKDSISFNTKVSRPDEKKCSPEQVQTQGVTYCSANSASMPEDIFSCQVVQTEVSGDEKYSKENDTIHLYNEDAPRQLRMASANNIPLPPSLEIKPGSEASSLEIQKNLQNLYEYNVMLREELITAQSMLHTLTSNASTSKQR